MKKRDFTRWTRKEFRLLPRPDSFWNYIGEVDSLVIVPCDYRHESGYRCLEFAAIQNGEPTYLLSGCSDIIHLGGIGGFNVYSDDIPKYAKRVKSGVAPIADWKIDCLPVSGLLHIRCNKKIIVGASISHFEIFYKEE
jgi:hypothetical protein